MSLSSLPAALILLLLSSNTLAQLSSIPSIDFPRLGSVDIAGTLSTGLSLFSRDNVTLNPAASTLFSTSSGALSPIGTTEDAGQIYAACELDSKVYVAGAFSQLGGTTAQNIISYDPSSSTFTALPNGGLNGAVNALYCDSSNHLLWVGGNFTLPTPAVVVYATSNSSWVPAPFNGLSGQVLSITPSASSQSLYFAGSFITAFQSNNTNSTFGNNPNVPYSAGATPYSSSLVPIPLAGADLNAAPVTTQTGFTDIANILCPAGPDGEGNTWLAQDGSNAQITVQIFRNEGVSGVRLGNTFVQGRGTTSFTVTTLPNNQVLPLSYVDPVTNTTQNCTATCPLLTNSSIPYQDFIFSSTPSVTITGFQVTLNSWTGAGAGLHLLQLLSEGSFASFVPSLDTASCFSPGPTTVTQSGTWQELNVTTDTAGTVQPVLQATFPTGTAPTSSPSLDLSVYVSAVGYYTVYFVTPGCTQMQDCDLRTTVQASISPGNGVAPVTQEIDQRVTSDTVSTIYRGPIYPSTPSFSIPVSLRLSDTPAGQGSNGNYDIVADQVQFVLTAAPNGTYESVVGEGVPGYNLTTSFGIARGFGIFEWSLNGATANATGTLANGTETAVDGAGGAMYAGILGVSNTAFSGGSMSSFGSNAITALAVGNDNQLFIGGSFSLAAIGAHNIAMWNGTALVALPSGGMSGLVSAMVVDQSAGYLYVGGSFAGLQSGSSSGYGGIALYDINKNQWSSMGGGVSGPVTDLAFDNGELIVVGNFTGVASNTESNLASSAGTTTAGLAAWSTSSQSWVSSPIGSVVGNMTFASSDSEFFAGNIQLLVTPSSVRSYLSEALVIIISIVIGAGSVLLLFLIGVLSALWLRRSEETPHLLAEKDADDGSSIDHHPSMLLEHVQAATRATIIGEGAFAAASGKRQSTEASREHAGDSSLETEEVPGEADVDGPFEDDGRVAHTRYSFEAASDGELDIRAGAQVMVLNDRDASWWLVRDVETGREGIIPASYLL
ncbi:hypothetical protein CALVIDRAFT_499824 [Calocera viscosa TUFC12733]|uniref:SH3 domain-containing protein n=1 Tax=Calocera viscosa (strain TUFC12733) TaxID=1330018 RepID=A0A167LBW8_CALVF|nr:hypothetical protein CALVIDRAFT_499824 [Calocera viscosa TUFC12733]